MPLTKPIPKGAMPVVEILRCDVPRPKELPTTIREAKQLRWLVKHHSTGFLGCCPMGLHPQSTMRVPTMRLQFRVLGATKRAIRSFFCWWDTQTDAQAATDAVWPNNTEDMTDADSKD